MGEIGQQVGSEPQPDAMLTGHQPSRPRPKVLIPPVASPMPAEPSKAARETSSRQFPPAPTKRGGEAAVVPSPAEPVAGEAATRQPVRTFRAPAARPGIARVYLTHVDPWSVMKQAFLLSLALAIIILVAAASMWFALDSAGVFDALTRTAADVGGTGGASVGSYLSLSKVMGVALVLAGIETVLVTALVTLFAFLYNLAVGIGGGLEVTLSEEG